MPAVKIAPKQLPIIRNDGWVNLFTGVGTSKDRRTASAFHHTILLTEQELLDLYRENGFARKIIDLPAGEMMRAGFEVTGDDEQEVNTRLDELKGAIEIKRLIRWGKLYGGAIMVIGLDDGLELDKPVNPSGIRNVIFLKVFDRWRVSWSTVDLCTDTNNPLYGQPEYYWVSPASGTPFRIHESRTLKMEGADIPELARLNNGGWSDSVITGNYHQIRALGEVYDDIEGIVGDFEQGVLTIQNLQELIASGQEAVVKKRLELIDLSRHVLNTTLLDEREKYEKVTSTVTGLPDLMDRFGQALSAVACIPFTLLFGRSAAGLNATGENDVRQWYDNIAVEQVEQLRPQLERLVRYIMLAKDGAFGGRELPQWKIKFNPLWQQTDKEIADTRKTVAETDAIYITNSVVDPAEIAISRFGGEDYSTDTTLAVERVEPDTQPDIVAKEAKEAEAVAAAEALKMKSQQPAVASKPKVTVKKPAATKTRK